MMENFFKKLESFGDIFGQCFLGFLFFSAAGFIFFALPVFVSTLCNPKDPSWTTNAALGAKMPMAINIFLSIAGLWTVICVVRGWVFLSSAWFK